MPGTCFLERRAHARPSLAQGAHLQAGQSRHSPASAGKSCAPTVTFEEINHQTIESGNVGEILALSEGGSFWLIRSIDLEPQATLERWSVRQTPRGHRHFCGRTLEGAYSESRISSPVVDFDPVRLRGRTATGRVYQLHGPAGTSPDSDYLWQRWLRINGFSEWQDVTGEVMA